MAELVECARLEIAYTGDRIGGSNPSISAKYWLKFYRFVMIDLNFDFYDDVPDRNVNDPDEYSQELRKYHKILWAKPLPNGDKFDLQVSDTEYLVYGNFRFGSDWITNLYMHHEKMIGVMNEIDGSVKEKNKKYTIASSLIFPKNGKNSINICRARNPISDRIDLTLECIRRYYDGVLDESVNPLGKCLVANKDFFDLFGGFENYVEFFLLTPLVSKDFKQVHFFLPFDNFRSNGYPNDAEQWMMLCKNVNNFIKDRTDLIRDDCEKRGILFA